MLHYLSEDPTYLAGGLGLVGLGLLAALRLTQQGKYLIWALTAFALAGAVLLVERLWVTDNERIEAVIYEVADAVGASDADRVASLLTADANIEVNATAIEGGLVMRYVVAALANFRGRRVTPELLHQQLDSLKFDMLRVSRLTTHAGQLSHRGTASFRVYASGVRVDPSSGLTASFATPTSGSDWSFGLREVEPKVWKVERITPTFIPYEALQSSISGNAGLR